jgi:hypothetical protein
MRDEKKLCLVVFSGALIVMCAPAQTTNGLITGVVTDPSGAVVPGARVRIIDETTRKDKDGKDATEPSNPGFGRTRTIGQIDFLCRGLRTPERRSKWSER